MIKKDLITKWLSLFWTSQVFSLNDIKAWNKSTKWWFDWSINHSIDSYIDVNEENPYWLFFTPNWNLWKVNVLWNKLIRSNSSCDWSVFAFYVDIDIKDTEYTSIEKLKSVTLDTIKEDNLPVSYMVQSWWWLHLYMFLEESSEYLLKWVNFKKVQEEFASRFDWWDLSSHSYNKLMRLPFSNHWKTLSPIWLKLYKLFNTWDEIEVDEVMSPDDITFPTTYLPVQYVKNLNKNLKESTDFRVDMNNPWKQKEIDADMAIINNIDISKILFTLSNKYEKYPKTYLWKNYRFSVDWLKINIETTDLSDWIVQFEETSWYRIKKEENFVNNFSWENYPIEERPRWWTFSFLYHYFDKDISKVKEFLENEFWIILKQRENYWYLNIKTFNWVIVFSKDWVFYNKEVKQKWEAVVVQKTLFEIPIEIMWVFSSKYTNFWEAEHPHNYYMMRRLDIPEDNEMIINFNVDRKAFNKVYWSTWLVFFWWEEDMLSFYSALNKASIAWQIPVLDFEYLNWFKKDKLIIWDKVYDKDFNIMPRWDLILKTQNIDMNFKWKDECTVKEFADMFIKLYSNRVSVLSIVTYITLFLWHDFWKIIWTYKQQSLIPWMICSWKTRAWKTTLLSILKEWSWLTIDTRKYSVKSTTAQPLKQAWTDSFLLHLEEFTWDIHPDKETIIRDILNKSTTARWTITWENINFIYRSSLILDGERLPVSQSVVNRTILIPMFESDKLWDEKSLFNIKNYFYLPDLTNKALTISEEDKLEHFKEAEEVLIWMWITWRNTMLYSFLLATNNIVKIVDKKLLLSTIKENFELLWVSEVWWDDVSDLFSHIIITNRIRPNIDYARFQVSDNSEIVWTLTLNMELMAEKRIDIIGMLKKYPKEAALNWYTISFNTNINSSLGSKLLTYRQYFNLNN